jgi:hypothetical protein
MASIGPKVSGQRALVKVPLMNPSAAGCANAKAQHHNCVKFFLVEDRVSRENPDSLGFLPRRTAQQVDVDTIHLRYTD